MSSYIWSERKLCTSGCWHIHSICQNLNYYELSGLAKTLKEFLLQTSLSHPINSTNTGSSRTTARPLSRYRGNTRLPVLQGLERWGMRCWGFPTDRYWYGSRLITCQHIEILPYLLVNSVWPATTLHACIVPGYPGSSSRPLESSCNPVKTWHG